MFHAEDTFEKLMSFVTRYDEEIKQTKGSSEFVCKVDLVRLKQTNSSLFVFLLLCSLVSRKKIYNSISFIVQFRESQKRDVTYFKFYMIFTCRFEFVAVGVMACC